jgi:UDP-N-acetylglucosamine:LPS N-acetylglucosamine transferase
MTIPRRILAVASGGGHWVQLMRLRPAWDGHCVTYVTTTEAFRAEVLRDAEARGRPAPGYFVVAEANRWQKLKLVRQFLGLLLVVLRVRPHVVITTGAAPGYFALRLGRLLGARTAWVDSIANADELSLSGRMAGRHANLWLTQWPDLARREGPQFRGAVL